MTISENISEATNWLDSRIDSMDCPHHALERKQFWALLGLKN